MHMIEDKQSVATQFAGLSVMPERIKPTVAGRTHQAEIHSELVKLVGQVGSFNNFLHTQNPTLTPAAQLKLVHTASVSLGQATTQSINHSSDIMRRASADLSRRKDERVNLRPVADAAEIRAVFRAKARKD